MSRFRCLLAALSLGLSLAAIPATVHAQTPAPAQSVLEASQKKAAEGKKNVLVVFGASWCGWCKRLDKTVLDNEEMRKLLDANYEIIHLDVQEADDKKALENPGGMDIQSRLGGARAGLPFYAVLDPKGKKLADSNVMPKGGNIGYPGSPEEIAAFADILKKTAPRLSESDRGKIVAHLKANAPK